MGAKNKVPRQAWPHIHRLAMTGESLRVIGDAFGVTGSAISYIIKQYQRESENVSTAIQGGKRGALLPSPLLLRAQKVEESLAAFKNKPSDSTYHTFSRSCIAIRQLLSALEEDAMASKGG